MESTATNTPDGGNKATDFQPTAWNPQNNVGGGLQQSANSLQNSAGSTAVSSYNGLISSPQTLSANSLQVVNSAAPGLATAPPRPASGPGWLLYFVIIIGFIVSAWLITYFVKANQPIEPTVPEEITPPPVVLKPPKRKKSKKARSKSRKK